MMTITAKYYRKLTYLVSEKYPFETKIFISSFTELFSQQVKFFFQLVGIFFPTGRNLFNLGDFFHPLGFFPTGRNFFPTGRNFFQLVGIFSLKIIHQQFLQ